MSILSKIKSLLPASSRSFHQMFGEVIKIREQNEEILKLLATTKTNTQSILDHCNSHGGRFDAFEAEARAILWELYKETDEDLLDAKRRLFRGLPKSEGALRSHQLMLASLLGKFDEICRQNGIEYFLAVGTLLGALRHEGFVPWDDDVDVGVLRDDIDRLIEIVNTDDEYEITVVYDQYSFCRQVRFKRKGSDDGKDPFIDLFIYEYSGCESAERLSRVKEIRKELMLNFEENPILYPLDTFIYANDEEICRSIQKVYDKYRNVALEEGLYKDKSEACSIIWSLENVSFGNSTHIIPIDDLKNMKKAFFEGLTCPILDHSEELLSKHYGDWLRMPTDINSHRHYASLG